MVPALSDDLHIKIKKRRKQHYGWASDDASETAKAPVQLHTVQEKESGRVNTNILQRAVKSRSGHSIKSIQSNHSG